MKVTEIFGLIMVFSFISIIFIFIAAVNIGVTNDYIMYTLQDTAEGLYAKNIITNNSVSFMQKNGDWYTTFNFHLDELWLFVYVLFWITSLVVAYQSEKENYFTFLGMLFYGTMLILFSITIVSSFTDWFRNIIISTVLPSAYLTMPKFYFYLDNVGIFSLMQVVVCIVVNMLDFDFAKIFFRKKQEDNALEDNEVV
jgi:hypothetical protein